MLKLSGKYDYPVTMIVYKEYINKVARGMVGGGPGTQDQAGLRDCPASDSHVLGLKVWTTTPSFQCFPLRVSCKKPGICFQILFSTFIENVLRSLTSCDKR